MSKNNVILVPQYMKGFKCIGFECEDNCCYGWKVQINQDAYKRYKKVSNGEIKGALEKYVTRNRSNPTIENYAKITMNTKGDCPFLRKDKLCNIYKSLGEEYLSKICTVYPRVTNIVNEIIEKSASLSCPEAARMALLNPDPMEFDECEEAISTQNLVIYQVNTEEGKYSNKVQRYFWDIRIFTISLLQNRKYMLWEKLIMLGFFTRRVEGLTSEGLIHSIPKLIEEYNSNIEVGMLTEELQGIPTRLEIQIDIIKKLNDIRLSGVINANCKEYIQCVSEFLIGLNYTDEAIFDDVVARYNEAYENYYKPFMDEHEYILENFLVNNVFKDMFPISDSKNIFDGYISLAVSYGLIKMMLVGMSSYHKGLNEDIIIKLIYSFSRTIEHSGFMNGILSLLNESGYNTLAYMCILIKN